MFDATGENFASQAISGLVFNWESSDPAKVQIDDTGRATFLGPGMTTITCSAGTVATTARVLVKPGVRPRQTDATWKADQESVPVGELGAIEGLLPSLLDKVAPTAHAQSGGYTGSDFGYDELWSDPGNLVGSPRYRAVESTTLGPVLPEGSNFNFAVPLIDLGGRGIGGTLALYGNTRVWSRHGSAVTFSAVGGFPFAGFSVGFGRILTYGPSNNTSLVWLDPDGTPHMLGSGNWSTSGTFHTTDGTQMTFVGSPAVGGTVYFNDGTQVSITPYNNRLVATQVKDRPSAIPTITTTPVRQMGVCSRRVLRATAMMATSDCFRSLAP